MEAQTVGQFLVALFMSLGGLSVFVWAVMAGQFHNVEEPKERAYRLEVAEDE